MPDDVRHRFDSHSARLPTVRLPIGTFRSIVFDPEAAMPARPRGLMLSKVAIRGARRLLSAIPARWRPTGRRDDAGFEPDYGDEALFIVLRSTADRERATILSDAVAAWSQGDALRAHERVGEHFLQRSTPRFFADVRGMLADPSIGDEVAQWREAVAADVRRMTCEKLDVLARTAPPLRAPFPWAQPVPDANEDLLFAVHPQRFQFLPRLALGVALDLHPCSHVEALVDDWATFAPSRVDLAFVSSLVVTQRVLATGWAIEFLRAARVDVRRLVYRLVRILAQDIAYLWPRLGQAYPNNHLLVDRFAAWGIPLQFPELVAAPVDRAACESAWTSELLRQTYEDGAGFEHATHYHALATELAAAYLLLATANDLAVPDPLRQRILRMRKLQALLAGPDGCAPQIGDCSDDPMYPLAGGASDNAAVLRELYRALEVPRLRALPSGHPARERACWLLGGRLADAQQDEPAASMHEWSQGGIAVLEENAGATRCVFRTGPIQGTHYMPGHMHDDALTISLVAAGVPMLVESGTYTYRLRARDPDAMGVDWRDHFSGRRAHNGVVLDDRHPSGRLRGDFRSAWDLGESLHRARACGSRLSFVEACLAPTAGQPRVARGVVHLYGAAFIVYDIVEAQTGSPPYFAFQWAPETLIGGEGRVLTAKRSHTTLRMVLSDGLGIAEHAIGRVSPPNGWVSRRYGERVAAPQSRIALEAPGRLTAFGISCADMPPLESIECIRPSSDARAFRLRSSSAEDIVVVNAGDPAVQVSAFGVEFTGRIAWLHKPAGAQVQVFWLEGSSFACPALARSHQPSGFVDEFVA